MNIAVPALSFVDLIFVFLPVLAVLGIFYYWSLDTKNAVYAILRMIVQLLIVGYLLTFIFALDSAAVVFLIIFMMIAAASWIALKVVRDERRSLYKKAVAAIGLGGGISLFFVLYGALSLESWYSPAHTIPLAGMVFAGAMNGVSLAAERMRAEIVRGGDYIFARKAAFQAAFIPTLNMLFSVGLVGFPGIMTGQILSGISPLVAVRYQMMVMAMIFAATGIAVAIFLKMAKNDFEK